eukprot:3212108-Lingulodinium_polyedra.AAC.1
MIISRSGISEFLSTSEAMKSGLTSFKADYPISESAKQKKKAARAATHDLGTRFQGACVACASA